jgi:1-acyl-sn-glycerol-3-phosphate acyltransferase
MRVVNRCWYSTVYWAAATAAVSGWSLRSIGQKNMPLTGPVLLVCNHGSLLDPVFIGVASPRRLAYLAKDSLFSVPVLGPLIRSLNAFPINRNVGTEGLRQMIRIIGSGEAMLFFPEGTRSADGEMQPFKEGICPIIARTPMRIVPAGIAGTFRAWPRHRLLPVPAPVAVSFGPPIDSSLLKGMQRADQVRLLADAVSRQKRKAESLL